MDKHDQGTETQQQSAQPIQISKLYKIFGPNPLDSLALLSEQQLSKDQLLEEHNHVLGLKDINLDIPAGEIFVIMGLSGSGKSTLIRHINRLMEPTSGTIMLGDQDVTELNTKQLRAFRSKYTAMVFQKFALFPHMNVLENVEYGLSVRGDNRKDRKKVAEHWLNKVGLSGYEDSYPKQLSGGMQQRVGLARALALDTPVLLMDEAFSALDPLIRAEMQDMLLDIQQEIGKTIVFITHDLDEALRLGDQVAILRDGEVIQQGTGQHLVLHPANDYIADFVRVVNRGRVIRCKALMQKGETAATADTPQVPANMFLEEAASIINEANAETAAVVDKQGKILGHISLSDIIQTIVPSEEQQG